MSSNKRRRLVGFLTALVVPAVVGAIAMPANALTNSDPLLAQTCTNIPNLVTNCGFEAAGTSSATAPGWTHLVDHFSGLSTSHPHSGTQSIYLASGGDDDVWTQTIKVSPHTQYLVGAWVNAYNNGTATNDFALEATNIAGSSDGVIIYSNTNLSPGWQHVGGVVTTYTGTTMTLIIRGANVPSDTYVDDVTVIAVPSGCQNIANNLVGNCSFEAGSPSPWVNSGTNHDSQISSTTAWGGSQSLRIASTTTDDTWYQPINTRPRTTYTLSYWVEYWQGASTPVNDLTVKVSNVPAASGGALKIVTTNVGNHFWAHVSKTFTTGTGSGAIVTIKGANHPDSTYVDDVSVTAVPHARLTAKGRATTTTLTGLGGQKVELEKLVNKSWRVIHTWTAPKTGWSKSWSFTVGSGGTYRSVSTSAPGYSSAASSSIVIK